MLHPTHRMQHRRCSEDAIEHTSGGTAAWASKIAKEQHQSRQKAMTIDFGHSSIESIPNVPAVSLGQYVNGYDELDVPTLERNFSYRSTEEVERPRGIEFF